MKIRRKKINGLKLMSYGMLAWVFIFPVIAFLILSPSCGILPKKSPEKFLEDGKDYYNKKNYKKAYKSYTRAIEGNRSLFIAYWERALVEIKMDSLENAIDDMGMYIESMRVKESESDRKLLEKALMQRAEIMLKKGYKSDACDDYSSACSLNISIEPCQKYRVICK